MTRETDVLIIGAGAVGCAIARELSAYDLRVTVVEREADAVFGISGRNSGVVHAGFYYAPGSRKARLCVEGSQGFEDLARELGIGYKRTGKLLIGDTKEDLDALRRLKNQGESNGVRDLEILEGDGIRRLEPAIRARYALWSPHTAVFDPFEYTLALAETAAAQGTEFCFSHTVTDLSLEAGGVLVRGTGRDGSSFVRTARAVINAAGLGAVSLRDQTGTSGYRLRPCRGEYHLLEQGDLSEIRRPVYPLPDERRGALGIHLTPTLQGNVMIGPGAEFVADSEDMANTEVMMEQLLTGARDILGKKTEFRLIRSFAGIRPKVEENGELLQDFRIEEDPSIPGLIHLLGIESPGMTASVPLAREIAALLQNGGILPSQKREHLPARWEGFPDLREHVGGKMICRCEGVTEGEVLQAWDNMGKLGALPTLKGLKNRTRLSMGGCQGGFCTLDVTELLWEKRGVSPETITYDGPGSELFPEKGGGPHGA